MDERPGPTGRIIKGPVSALSSPAGKASSKAVSSIPAKFETVLFRGPRERKGFGSEARRFGDNDSDLPGPGSYVGAGPTMEFTHDSIGKKGFGTMVSKGARFKDRVQYTGPGPGDYKGAILGNTEDFNRAALSSAFQSVATVSRRTLDPRTTLGPGTYSATETRHGVRLGFDNAAGARSAFLAKPHELEVPGNADVPPPNAYQMTELWGEGRSYRGGSGSSTSSFAPRSFSLASDAHSIVFEEANQGRPRLPDTGPGPGAYDVLEYASIRSAAVKSAGRMSSAFNPQEFTDRMGKSLRTASAGPGPGTYHVASIGETASGAVGPRPGVSAPFISRSAGHAEVNNAVASEAPGPAYYSKTMPPPGRKSFHLNSRERYVTRA